MNIQFKHNLKKMRKVDLKRPFLRLFPSLCKAAVPVVMFDVAGQLKPSAEMFVFH